uniref:Uncharacterized protein n=1 Tax=Arundo donax TaxID=35708 RepID=A0A0A8ZV41_ARUDO
MQTDPRHSNLTSPRPAQELKRVLIVDKKIHMHGDKLRAPFETCNEREPVRAVHTTGSTHADVDT